MRALNNSSAFRISGSSLNSSIGSLTGSAAGGKAFGTGLGADLHLTSVSVLHGPEEGPLVVLDDKASALLARQGGTRVLVSLTHTDDLAQAFAVIVR